MPRLVTCIAGVLLTATVWPAQAADLQISGSRNLIAAENGGQLLKFTSQHDDSRWAARNVIDGQHWVPTQEATGEAPRGWSSRKRRFPQEFLFAFQGGRAYRINQVVVDPVTADPYILGRGPRHCELLVSDTTPDGTFRSVVKFQVRNIPKVQSFYFLPANAKYVKFRILSNWGSDKFVELGEIEVREAITGDGGELDQLIIRQEKTISALRRYYRALEAAAEGGLRREPLNVAAAANGGHIISKTSEQNDTTWAAHNLIDGLHVVDANQPRDRPRGWSATAAPSPKAPQEIVIGFDKDIPRLIDRVRLDPRTTDPALIGRHAKQFNLYVLGADENAQWEQIGSYELVLDPGSTQPPIPQTFSFAPVEARRIKLSITSNYGSDKYCELGEFEVYEANITSSELQHLVDQLEQQLADLKTLRDTHKYGPPEAARKVQEADLLWTLRDLRLALKRFAADTGCFPLKLADLAATEAPAKAMKPGGTKVALVPETWKGPYLPSGRLPVNPITQTNDEKAWTYNPKVGTVQAANAGMTTRGIPYAAL